ncbi:MAG TPA: M23 family metallopeptidase [Pyrinomonadaceae bacterium]|jgi:murein DD-endopeptidase MepM/ murein hydrolase activator NlpD|nr:M23 family metallopeptidase [Pyrinomonadaceae bacterium]
MNRDERLYAFIVSRTSRSRSSIRRFSVHKRWVKASALAATMVFCAAAYGVYGLSQQATHTRIEEENDRLRMENERQRRQLQKLENRVDAIEDASRRLSEMSGGSREEEGTSTHGAGGPALKLDGDAIANVESRAARLEEDLQAREAALQGRVPSIWPVEGEMTDGFGVRGNPFGGGSSEFHPGQDIAAPRGTSVVAAADGTIVQAGWQNGYGQEVVIDHGHGLTTRYGHLSKIEVAAGQAIRRGEELGQVGSTGRSTGPHLHYEVRIDDVAVSPLHYLPTR